MPAGWSDWPVLFARGLVLHPVSTVVQDMSNKGFRQGLRPSKGNRYDAIPLEHGTGPRQPIALGPSRQWCDCTDGAGVGTAAPLWVAGGVLRASHDGRVIFILVQTIGAEASIGL